MIRAISAKYVKSEEYKKDILPTIKVKTTKNKHKAYSKEQLEAIFEYATSKPEMHLICKMLYDMAGRC